MLQNREQWQEVVSSLREALADMDRSVPNTPGTYYWTLWQQRAYHKIGVAFMAMGTAIRPDKPEVKPVHPHPWDLRLYGWTITRVARDCPVCTQPNIDRHESCWRCGALLD